MREIKFKAWDTKDKLWIAGFSIEQSGTLSKIGNKVFMQFTGLLDRHGKEIYEGDIVNDSFYGNPEFGHSVIEYMNGCFYACGKRKTRLGSEMTSIPRGEDRRGMYCEKYLEVIGNIYSDPDLINKLK